MINILERQLIWETLRFHIPMLICATWVIITQRKIILDTFKRWWSWGLRNWTKERKDYMMIYALGVVAFIFTIFIAGKTREELAIKQKQEVVEKMLEQKIVTPAELQKIQEKEKQEQELGKKRVPLPLYSISPLLCFILVCIIAPLGEECVFRYIIFEIFDKNNPLPYIFSGGSFIFLHWLGPASGLLNFTTIKLLLLAYLPITILLIYAYRKSKWNITYPIFFHFLWNSFVFSLTI